VPIKSRENLKKKRGKGLESIAAFKESKEKFSK